MSKLLSKDWWLSVLERAIKTFAEVFLATMGTSAVFLEQVPWLQCLSAGALGIVCCVLINVATLPDIPEKK